MRSTREAAAACALSLLGEGSGWDTPTADVDLPHRGAEGRGPEGSWGPVSKVCQGPSTPPSSREAERLRKPHSQSSRASAPLIYASLEKAKGTGPWA